MLHKKKRWTAAMHGTGQSAVPVLLPAAASPTKNQWSNFSVNTGNKSVPRHTTPPNSMQLYKQQSTPNVQHSADGFSAAIQTNQCRTTSVDGLQASARLSSPTRYPLTGDNTSGPCTAGLRNDITASLLNSIAQSTELLQQPGLLLQILPQEYIEKYTKSLERRIGSDKPAYDLVNSAGKLIDGPSRSNEITSSSSLFQGPQSSHRPEPIHQSESHHVSYIGPITTSTSGYKLNSVEQTKTVRSTPSAKNVATSQVSLLSSPGISNTDSQRFSPSRRSGGSSDPHLNKSWNPTAHHPTAQQLAGLDYSTTSAVAHAASLIHSSSRQNASTGLFSPWENTGLVPQTTRDPPNVRGDTSIHKPLYSLAISMVPSPVGFYSDGSSTSPHTSRSSNNVSDVPKHRTPHDTPSTSIRVPTPINLKPVPESRRQVLKTTVPTCRHLDTRMHLPVNSGLPSADPARLLYTNPPWLSTEQIVNSNLSTSQSPEAADARLSILHDAKMAALSVDWPSSASSVSAASLKNQRARSSSSFSSILSSSSSDVSPMFHSAAQQSHSTLTPSSRDVFHISPSSSNVGSVSPTSLIHTRPGITCSSPVLIARPVKSPPSHSSVYSSASRQSGIIQNSLSIPSNIIQGRIGTNSCHNRLNDGKPPTSTIVSSITSDKMISPNLYSKSPFVVDPWIKSVYSSNPQLEAYLPSKSSSLIMSSCGENTIGRQSDSRSFMPLKKRLIQRYEADNGSCKTRLDQLNAIVHTKLSPHSTSSLHSDSPCPPSEVEGQNSNLSGLPTSRLLTPTQIPGGQKLIQNSHISESSDENVLKVTKDDYKEAVELRKNQTGQGVFIQSHETLLRKPTKRSVGPAPQKRNGGLNAPRKGGHGARHSDSARSLKVSKPGTDSTSMKPETIEDKVSRKSVGSRRGGRVERFPARVDDVPRRRATSISRTSVISSRTRQTDSSPSRGSSCSLRSLEQEPDDSDVDRTYNSTEVADHRQIGKSMDHLNSTQSLRGSNHPVNERVRKPKRAAALVASAAAAASITMNAKRPRLTAQVDLGTRRNVGAHDEDSVEDDSLDIDDASSTMTTDSKPNNVINNDKNGSVLEELSAVLSEDKTLLGDLIQQLPGPPDLQQLTNRSLHPVHSLDYYKRSRTAFVQLVSCNDPGLRPIPKCRACRQLKRSHYDLSDPDLTISDEDSRDHVGPSKSSSGNTGNSNSGTTAEDGENFKRPSGRNTQADHDKSRDNSNDAAAARSEKSRRRTIASSPVSVFCRFWGFRRLIFNNRGVLKIAGFCQSNEASVSDRSLWEMHHSVSPSLDPENAKYIVERAGKLFCRLLRQELAVLTSHHGQDPNSVDRGPGAPSKNGLKRDAGNVRSSYAVAWKRPVKGVREMCDVCETTMFNTHWVCAKCGYSVCVDCQEEARENKIKRKQEADSGTSELALSRDRVRGKQSRARAGPPGWASCTTTRQHHDPERLLLTSLLPSSTVGKLLHRVHRIARHYQIRLGCDCPISCDTSSGQSVDKADVVPTANTENSLGLLADVALKSDASQSSLLKSQLILDPNRHPVDESKLPPHTWIRKPHPLSPKHMSDSEERSSKYLVLQIHNSQSAGVFEAFRHQWQANRPVIVSGCQTRFDPSLWTPRSFADEFGPLRTTLVDCATGMELTRYPLRTFWDGFERKSRRLVSKDGRTLCLKLKDWPTTDDFAELQPHRFADLMSNLPLSAYTCRDGQMNLSSRLTSFFVCPDLGPKLYVAYGTGGSRSMGTTNLHVDIADAINILLYVGYPNDSIEESSANAEAVLNVMRQAQVDPVYLDRATTWMKSMQLGHTSTQTQDEANSADSDSGPPGALWHIFLPEDMPALREFLTRITEEETGAPLEPGSDPVHDQLFYLDQPLLDRLYSFAGILPCTLIQFKGDAIFIPAGAAHQVRNLNSCIKAAVDFVSPEHLPQCFQLIEEFRRLSSTHQNHEDKLQVKNMLFHATKDALSALLCSVNNNETNTELQEPDSPLMQRICQLVETNVSHTLGKSTSFVKPGTVDSDSSEPSSRSARQPDYSHSKVALFGRSSRGRPPGRPKSVKCEEPLNCAKQQSPNSDLPTSLKSPENIPNQVSLRTNGTVDSRRHPDVLSSHACGSFDSENQ